MKNKNINQFVREFLKSLQEGFLEDEGIKYSLKELAIKYDYEIKNNVIPDAQDIINDSYTALTDKEYKQIVEETTPLSLSKMSKGDYKK